MFVFTKKKKKRIASRRPVTNHANNGTNGFIRLALSDKKGSNLEISQLISFRAKKTNAKLYNIR